MTDRNKDRFAGKTVLITGASQGIGEDAAIHFARQGARVAINGRKAEKLEPVLKKLAPVPAGPHIALTGDMSVEDDIERVMQDAIDQLGGLDILICNAGMQIASPSEDITLKDFQTVMALNVTGVVLSARAALKYWRRNDIAGNIIVNSSVHQQIPKPHYLGYSASKGAVGNVVRTLALEYARYGIRVNGVAPGAIVTPINDAWVNDPEQYKVISSHIPMQRPGESREISNVMTFLASEEASYITGQTLFVDGGLTLYADFEKNWSS